MNPANLPFDSETMLQGLRGWVECESPTWDAAAVDRMLDIAARDMAIMGATIERIAGRRALAAVSARAFRIRKQGEPGILIAGHMDTVHPGRHASRNCNGGARATSATAPASST